MAETMNAEYGVYLGYPECCIKAFGDRPVPAVFRAEVIRKHMFNRFVPCGSHATRMESGELTRQQLIDDINTRRKCSVPFKESITAAEDRIISDELWALMAE